MIEKVKKQVYELLNKDNSGHGNDHIDRVLDLSLKCDNVLSVEMKKCPKPKLLYL